MTYSLNTLHQSKDKTPAPVSGWQRFVQEIALYLGFVLLLYWLVAMLSHSPQDPAWTTSGSGLVPKNWGGRIGAAVSDLSFFVAGYSIFWCFLAALISWMKALAARLRSEDAPEVSPPAIWRLSAWAFWSGLLLLMLSSTALEYTRLYRLDPHLPGHHAGGILGYLVGGAAAKWLGFNGSALVFIVFMLVGLSWTFGFSW
jgi:S-DNA-T family DNA segregation ATPase FtsK/SpoIIIE